MPTPRKKVTEETGTLPPEARLRAGETVSFAEVCETLPIKVSHTPTERLYYVELNGEWLLLARSADGKECRLIGHQTYYGATV